MINSADIPNDEETHQSSGASTGTNYSAYILLREKYCCEDLTEAIFSNEFSPFQKIHFICSIAVTWDNTALTCYEHLLEVAPEYKILDLPLSSWIMDKIGLFSSVDAANIVRKYLNKDTIKGTKIALERIERNINLNIDPAKTWGRANAKA